MIEGVYINLERSRDRRDSVERQWTEIDPGYPLRRFAAVDGSALPDCPAGLLPSQYGCWLSHLRALEQGPPQAHLHLMEDDALLGPALPTLPELIEIMEAVAGEDWDLLYLDATLVEVPDMFCIYEWTQSARARGVVHVHAIPRAFTIYGTHSYVVNWRRRGHVLDFLRRYLPLHKPIDNVIAHGVQRGELKAFVSTPFVTSGAELGLASTIGASGDDRFLAWLMFRRLCFCGLGEEETRQMHERLAALLRGKDPQAVVLGALIAYRAACWPQQHFPTGIEP